MRIDAELTARLMRFTVVGLGAMAAYAVIVTLLHEAGLRPAWLASGAAYALAAIWSYVGHRRYSFRSNRPHAAAGPRFALATAAGQGLAIAIPAVVTDAGGWPALYATIAVCIICPAFSFLLNALFVFPAQGGKGDTA